MGLPHSAAACSVFGRLCDISLTLNLVKCEFGQVTVMYLGKIVVQGQVVPMDSKVEAFLSFPASVSGDGKTLQKL